jgi:hypothetical protein
VRKELQNKTEPIVSGINKLVQYRARIKRNELIRRTSWALQDDRLVRKEVDGSSNKSTTYMELTDLSRRHLHLLLLFEMQEKSGYTRLCPKTLFSLQAGCHVYVSACIDAGKTDDEWWCIGGTVVRPAWCAAGGGRKGDPEEPAEHAFGRSRGGFSA